MSDGFTGRYRVRFAHCDPAGIAYYPRCLELCDAAIEDWCEAVLAPRSILHMQMGLGLPTVDLRARFGAVCRLGDLLDIGIDIKRVGRTSVGLSADVRCDGEPRFGVDYTQVLMNLAEARSTPWPEDMRERLLAQSRQETAA